jgi:hypothetical protein
MQIKLNDIANLAIISDHINKCLHDRPFRSLSKDEDMKLKRIMSAIDKKFVTDIISYAEGEKLI